MSSYHRPRSCRPPTTDDDADTDDVDDTDDEAVTDDVDDTDDDAETDDVDDTDALTDALELYDGSTRQCEEHPSPFIWFPSSHSSCPAYTY